MAKDPNEDRFVDLPDAGGRVIPQKKTKDSAMANAGYRKTMDEIRMRFRGSKSTKDVIRSQGAKG